jgi:hypothetical protein
MIYRRLKESFIVIQHDCLTVSWLVLNTNMQNTLVFSTVYLLCVWWWMNFCEKLRSKLLILMRKNSSLKKRKKNWWNISFFFCVCLCVCVCVYAAVLWLIDDWVTLSLRDALILNSNNPQHLNWLIFSPLRVIGGQVHFLGGPV